MMEHKTWTTLVSKAEDQRRLAQEALGLAKRSLKGALLRRERVAALLAEAPRQIATGDSRTFIQGQAYAQKLQQLLARVDQEILIFQEEVSEKDRRLRAAELTASRYGAVLKRVLRTEAQRTAKAEQKSQDASALNRFLKRQGLAGGFQ